MPVSLLVIGPHGAAFPAFGRRSLSAAKMMRMSDCGIEDVFLRLRWPETEGRPVCPDCGCSICYPCRRPAGPLRWRCKACRRDFSITSGTLFAWHKLLLRSYLLAVAAFCSEVKGKSMLAFSRELDVQHKTAFVLAHKLREAIAKRSHGDTVFGVKQEKGHSGECERRLRADDGVGVDEQLAGDSDESVGGDVRAIAYDR